MKKAIRSVLFILILTILFFGCSKKSAVDNDNTVYGRKPELTELKICFYYRNTSPYMDEVIKEIEKRSADKLNIKLNINWIEYGGYFDTIRAMLKAGDTFDAWMSNISYLPSIMQHQHNYELASSLMDITKL